MDPCWAVMLAFQQPISCEDSAILLTEGERQPLSWIMRDSIRRDQNEGDKWVLHAGPEWSRENSNLSRGEVIEKLFASFCELMDSPPYEFADCKLWRYASGGRSNKFGYLVDPTKMVLACGDWANGGRIEGAYLSGKASAEYIIENFVRFRGN